VARLGRPPTRRRETFLPRDVEVAPDHAQLLQLLDAVLVHVPEGVEAPVVRDPLPQGEPGERGRPPFGLHRLVAAAGHPVGEGHLQVAVQPVGDDGGLDAASPVLMLGVEDPQVDERRQLRRVARRGELQQLPGGRRRAAGPVAPAQRSGDRAFQRDATAVCTALDGTRAYVLLDGVGDTLAVRSWTRTAARRLARAAAEHADAEAGLRAEYDHYAADPARTVGHDLPCAAAVVPVHVPGGLFSVAWSGDARACLLLDGHLRRLSEATTPAGCTTAGTAT
jgi:hypothetical protein